MKASLKAGLAAAVLLGIALAAFPLYSGVFMDAIWSSGKDYCNVEGVIEEVDAQARVIVVEGVKVSVRGSWTIYGIGEANSWEVMEMLKPGYQVEIYCSEDSKWGLVAERIVVEDTGIVMVRG